MKMALSAVILAAIAICPVFAADLPVKIAFDPAAKHADLAHGTVLPVTVAAAPGSVRFHLLRLDGGDEFVYYMFDTLRKVNIADLASMTKDQGEFAIWNLVWKNGQGLHPPVGPRIHHLAVSFAPLGADGKEGARVYYRLADLARIEWAEVKR